KEIKRNIINNMKNKQKDYYKKFKENSREINILTKEQEKEIHNAKKVNNKTKNYHNKHLKGFEEIKFDSKMSSFEISDDNGMYYLHCRGYQDKKTNAYIMTTAIYNAESNTLISFSGDKKTINNNSTEKVDTETLIQYNKSYDRNTS